MDIAGKDVAKVGLNFADESSIEMQEVGLKTEVEV